jgi:hypothetical protein
VDHLSQKSPSHSRRLAFQKHDFSEHSWIFPADTP